MIEFLENEVKSGIRSVRIMSNDYENGGENAMLIFGFCEQIRGIMTILDKKGVNVQNYRNQLLDMRVDFPELHAAIDELIAKGRKNI